MDAFHELAELASVISASCEFLALHPTRLGPQAAEAMADLTAASKRLTELVRAELTERANSTAAAAAAGAHGSGVVRRASGGRAQNVRRR